MTFFAPSPPQGFVVKSPDKWRMWSRLTDVPVPDWEEKFKTYHTKKLAVMGICREADADDWFDNEPEPEIDEPGMIANFWVSPIQKNNIKDQWHVVMRLDLVSQEKSLCIVKVHKTTQWDRRNILRTSGVAMTLPYDTAPEEVVRMWKATRKAA